MKHTNSNKVRDFEPTEFRNNIIAHAAMAQLFDIPIVLTTSAETGPNGPLPKEITEMHPDAPIIRRNGEVDAWDNADFRKAVRDTGKSQVILAGITTDVCASPLNSYVVQRVRLTRSPRHSLPRTLSPRRRLHRLCQHRSQWHVVQNAWRGRQPPNGRSGCDFDGHVQCGHGSHARLEIDPRCLDGATVFGSIPTSVWICGQASRIGGPERDTPPGAAWPVACPESKSKSQNDACE